MSAEKNKQIVVDAYSAVNRGDIETYLSCLADDVQYTFFGSHRFGRTFTGKQDLIENLFIPIAEHLDGGIKIHITNVISEADQVVLEVQGEAVTKQGNPYNNLYCLIIKLKANKISVIREYMDTDLTKSIFG